MKQAVAEADSLPSGEFPPVKGDSRKHDLLSRKGATDLAQRLQDYWHARGYKAARFWTEPVTERFGKLGTHEVHRIRCNLVDGLPPRYLDEA